VLKIYENDNSNYSEYRKLINRIADDIKSGVNANLSKNIKNTFKKYGGEVNVIKSSPKYLMYNGYIFCDARNGKYAISGSVSLDNLNQDVNKLAEDIAYVQYLNDGGKDVGIPMFLDILY